MLAIVPKCHRTPKNQCPNLSGSIPRRLQLKLHPPSSISAGRNSSLCGDFMWPILRHFRCGLLRSPPISIVVQSRQQALNTSILNPKASVWTLGSYIAQRKSDLAPHAATQYYRLHNVLLSQPDLTAHHPVISAWTFGPLYPVMATSPRLPDLRLVHNAAPGHMGRLKHWCTPRALSISHQSMHKSAS